MTDRNPLLDDLGSFPSTMVALPTLGRFYRPGVLAEGIDPSNIEVGAPTIIDDLGMQDPFKVLSGKALTQLIRRSCRDVLVPESLAKVDVDAILIAARISGVGSTIDITAKCSNAEHRRDDGTVGPCGNTRPVTVNLLDVLSRMTPCRPPEDWRVTIEMNSKTQVVQLGPVSNAAVMKAMRSAAIQARDTAAIGDKVTLDDVEKIQTAAYDTSAIIQVEMLVDIVKSVTTSSGAIVTDKETIADYVSRLPRSIVAGIQELAVARSEEISKYATARFDCDVCGKSTDIYVAQDPTGFFSHGSRAAEPKPRSISVGKQPRRPTRS